MQRSRPHPVSQCITEWCMPKMWSTNTHSDSQILWERCRYLTMTGKEVTYSSTEDNLLRTRRDGATFFLVLAHPPSWSTNSTYKQHTKDIRKTYKRHIKAVQKTYRRCANDVQKMHKRRKKNIKNVNKRYKKHTKDVQRTYKRHIKDVRKTYKRSTKEVQKAYNRCT